MALCRVALPASLPKVTVSVIRADCVQKGGSATLYNTLKATHKLSLICIYIYVCKRVLFSLHLCYSQQGTLIKVAIDCHATDSTW